MIFLCFHFASFMKKIKTVHRIRKSTDVFCPGDRREITEEGSHKPKHTAKLRVTSEKKLPIKSEQILCSLLH